MINEEGVYFFHFMIYVKLSQTPSELIYFLSLYPYRVLNGVLNKQFKLGTHFEG